MPEVGVNVVAAEWQHRHWISSHLANGTGRCRRGLGGHRCANVDTMFPIVGLEDERHGVAPPSTKNNRVDRNPGRILYLRVEDRIVPHGSSETTVWMRG